MKLLHYAFFGYSAVPSKLDSSKSLAGFAETIQRPASPTAASSIIAIRRLPPRTRRGSAATASIPSANTAATAAPYLNRARSESLYTQHSANQLRDASTVDWGVDATASVVNPAAAEAATERPTLPDANLSAIASPDWPVCTDNNHCNGDFSPELQLVVSDGTSAAPGTDDTHNDSALSAPYDADGRRPSYSKSVAQPSQAGWHIVSFHGEPRTARTLVVSDDAAEREAQLAQLQQLCQEQQHRIEQMKAAAECCTCARLHPQSEPPVRA